MVELHRQVQEKNRQLEEMALTDPLTGLPNRRAIDVWAIRELSAAARHDFSIWVVMADLDHFKSINDTYGHDAGDTVLKGFAEVLKSNTRESDICGRLGGEEFLVVITHAEKKGSRLPSSVSANVLRPEGSPLQTKALATQPASESPASAERPSPNFSDLMACADAALYSAKQKGRNRIEFALE